MYRPDEIEGGVSDETLRLIACHRGKAEWCASKAFRTNDNIYDRLGRREQPTVGSMYLSRIYCKRTSFGERLLASSQRVKPLNEFEPLNEV